MPGRSSPSETSVRRQDLRSGVTAVAEKPSREGSLGQDLALRSFWCIISTIEMLMPASLGWEHGGWWGGV